MQTINFAGRYLKMPNNAVSGSTVKLLEVFNGRFEDLGEEFREYDARKSSGCMYNMPKKGDCIVLVLYGRGSEWDSGEIFTTVRRWTEDKEEYYRRGRGTHFIINY